ncbi:tyrosine-type recombinase/integrase [Tenggerimyces flavus]|uniref:Tyrosine-type recombinase/integrase n=1 Tax=Tenggerimyces flavus TaxID=1708749 RepID=A0ABV7YLN2_9ACTN|nr:tyrosine-type recombinase/integrase [Tenggerimyces flavus]MBM7787775.1 site-specific recombinase XerD [Tenggerimyces flavus]
MPELLDDLHTMWQRDLRAADKSPRTITIYGQSVRFFVAWLASHERPATLDEMTKAAVATWLGDLADAGQAPNTLRTRFRGLRRFCNWLVAEEFLTRSPMAGLEQPTAAAAPVPILSDDEIAKLLKATGGRTFEDRRDHAILRVLFDGGVRISECARLQLEDVDLDDFQVIRVQGKGRKIRVVPIGAKTVNALSKYLHDRRPHKHADSPALWLSQRGAMSVDGVDERIRVRAAQAGVENLHAHRFRHTAAHTWLSSGGGEQDLKRLMGWSSDAMLAVYGASAAEERAREAARRMRLGDRL